MKASMIRFWVPVFLTILLASYSARGEKAEKAPKAPLDQYVREAMQRSAVVQRTPGAIWSSSSPMADLGRDLRARFLDDLVTILVVERASATARGSVDSNRQSEAKGSIVAAGGVMKPASRLTDLLDLNTSTALSGAGATTRETSATTTLTGRVVAVLPNGNLVVEAVKEVLVNSERQLVNVRGIVRPFDLTPANVVRSDRLGQLEVSINGKGVVGDAIRRPFILYRILLGLLPF